MSLLSHECVALIQHIRAVLLGRNDYLASSRDCSFVVYLYETKVYEEYEESITRHDYLHGNYSHLTLTGEKGTYKQVKSRCCSEGMRQGKIDSHVE